VNIHEQLQVKMEEPKKHQLKNIASINLMKVMCSIFLTFAIKIK
jgi:hypothetical protein